MKITIDKGFSGVKVLTAGIPLSTPVPQNTYKGIDRILELGLDGMEIEFVHGVRSKLDDLLRIGNYAKSRSVFLTVHAPYYVNLNSKDSDKYKKSKEHIKKSMIAAEKLGAWSVAIHPAFYTGDDHNSVFDRVVKAFEEINMDLRELGYSFGVWMRPETMGKPTQFGSLEEVVKLSKIFDNVLPCVDLGHLIARTNGKYNSETEIYRLFEYIHKELGDYAIKNMHIHMEGIVYNDKGEKYHSTFADSDIKFEIILKAMKEFCIEGCIVSESSNIEADALIIKEYLTKII